MYWSPLYMRPEWGHFGPGPFFLQAPVDVKHGTPHLCTPSLNVHVPDMWPNVYYTHYPLKGRIGECQHVPRLEFAWGQRMGGFRYRYRFNAHHTYELAEPIGGDLQRSRGNCMSMFLNSSVDGAQ